MNFCTPRRMMPYPRPQPPACAAELSTNRRVPLRFHYFQTCSSATKDSLALCQLLTTQCSVLLISSGISTITGRQWGIYEHLHSNDEAMLHATTASPITQLDRIQS